MTTQISIKDLKNGQIGYIVGPSDSEHLGNYVMAVKIPGTSKTVCLDLTQPTRSPWDIPNVQERITVEIAKCEDITMSTNENGYSYTTYQNGDRLIKDVPRELYEIVSIGNVFPISGTFDLSYKLTETKSIAVAATGVGIYKFLKTLGIMPKGNPNTADTIKLLSKAEGVVFTKTQLEEVLR